MNNFGPHLTLDMKNCSLEKISSLQYVFDFLNNLPEQIGMTKITQPFVFPYSGLVPEDAGITGVVIIAESHITFHSFIHKNHTFFDIFSCKYFDVEKTKQLVLDAFECKDWDEGLIQRGRDFPRGE